MLLLVIHLMFYLWGISNPPAPSQLASLERTILELLLNLFTFASIVQQYRPRPSDSTPDNLGLIYTLVALIISGFITYLTQDFRLMRHLRKPFTKMDSAVTLNKFFYCLVILVERADSPLYRSQLQTVAHLVVDATKNISAYNHAREHLQAFMLLRRLVHSHRRNQCRTQTRNVPCYRRAAWDFSEYYSQGF